MDKSKQENLVKRSNKTVTMYSKASKLYFLIFVFAVFALTASESTKIYEHSRGSLNCPWGTVKVLSASFGLNQTLDCPSLTNPQACTGGANDLAVVARECDGKTSCSLYASTSVFGDPCPGRGKYLDVLSFECASTINLCENNIQTLRCYESRRIRILGAEYARTEANVCNDSPHTSPSCTGPNALAIVKSTCEEWYACTLQASSSVFGDPCPGYGKYLKVMYYCS